MILGAEAFSGKGCSAHTRHPRSILFPAKHTPPPSICKLGRVGAGECRLCLSLAHTRQIPELSAWNAPESANSWVSIPVRRQLLEEHLAPVSILSAALSHIYFLKKSLLGGGQGEQEGKLAPGSFDYLKRTTLLHCQTKVTYFLQKI